MLGCALWTLVALIHSQLIKLIPKGCIKLLHVFGPKSSLPIYQDVKGRGLFVDKAMLSWCSRTHAGDLLLFHILELNLFPVLIWAGLHGGILRYILGRIL